MSGLSGIFGGGGGQQATLQTTVYAREDDGDYRKELVPSYNVLTAGQYSGTTNLDVPHYAAATISFDAASKEIRDSANGLAIFKTADTIRVRGSAGNEQVLTVATGNDATKIITTEALVDEIAGAYITICKRVAVSNNCVYDNLNKRMWLRYTTGGPVQNVGAASDGKLCWYDATKCYTLHPAAADLQMIATSSTLRIVGGAGEVARYNAGYRIICSGFANANNNLAASVLSVTVNGANLDIVYKIVTINGVATAPLTAEAAGGSRAIKLVCQSIFGYVAAANAVSLGGYTDWRVPSDIGLRLLSDMQAPTALPNATAFPSWSSADYYWSATTLPDSTTYAVIVSFAYGVVYYSVKTGVYFLALVRG